MPHGPVVIPGFRSCQYCIVKKFMTNRLMPQVNARSPKGFSENGWLSHLSLSGVDVKDSAPMTGRPYVWAEDVIALEKRLEISLERSWPTQNSPIGTSARPP